VSNSTIVQVDWYDLIKLTDEQVKQGNISAKDWQRAMQDFRHKGLVQ
jgi:disulfide oxidoreductase YuzD